MAAFDYEEIISMVEFDGGGDFGGGDSGGGDAGEGDVGVLDAGEGDIGVLDAGEVDVDVLDAGEGNIEVLDSGETDYTVIESDEVPLTVTPENMESTEQSDYDAKIQHTPIRNGQWVDENVEAAERGNSKWVPDNPDAKEELAKFSLDGINYQNGEPDFSPVSQIDLQLAENECTMRNREQFMRCNESLQTLLETNPSYIRSRFTEEQIADIELGETPYGYTWHHDANVMGKMQLVPTSIHQACGHLGGQSVWGGGQANR